VGVAAPAGSSLTGSSAGGAPGGRGLTERADEAGGELWWLALLRQVEAEAVEEVFALPSSPLL
jgi:hypothetical protein